MATLGMGFVCAKKLSKERRVEIENFIKSLNFKKDIPVCIAFYQDVSDVLVDYRRLDYLIILNPEMELSYVEKRLFEKGVLLDSVVEHPTFKKNPTAITLIFPKNLDEKMIEEAQRVFNLMHLKINSKSFVDRFEFNKNECTIYLNNFKDLVAYALFDSIRWHICMANLPQELMAKIEGGKPFKIIDKNDYFVAISQEEKDSMEKISQNKKSIF